LPSPFIHEWLLAHARARPEAPAVDAGTARLTYGELADRVRRLAAALRADGVAAGDNVLIALPNTPATIVAALAAQLIGAVPVEIGRDPTPATVARAAGLFTFRGAFVAARDLDRWAGSPLDVGAIPALWAIGLTGATAAAPTGRARHLAEDGRFADSSETPPHDATLASSRAPGDRALVLFTSGSTGAPHAVAQSHRNLDANSRAIVESLGLTSDDRALLTLPLSYCYGRSVLQTHLLVGGSVVLETRTAFPAVVLGTLVAERCTGFAGVPLTFELIRRQVDVARFDLGALRYVTQAGGPMAPDTIRWAREAFAPAELVVMYGQTEATARLAYLPPARAWDKAGSVGIAIPGVELAVVDDDGRQLPTGEMGNLVARGDNVTNGYVDEPEATAEILRDGWLWTGDLARMDDEGYVTLGGRRKEILKVNGHRVSVVEMEHVLAGHPAVADVAVLGVPDPLAGDVPVALIVLKPGEAPTDDDLRAYCRAALRPAAVPVRYLRVDAVPRGPNGKILRAELPDRLAALGEAAEIRG